jgi:hypothetical protein
VVWEDAGMDAADLDPRWEWIEIIEFGKAGPDYVRGQCRHTELVPVESGGEVLAKLCLTCDKQFTLV